MWVRRIVILAAAFLYAWFLAHFSPERFDPAVDGSWLAACALFTLAFWQRPEQQGVERLRQPWELYVAYLALLVPWVTNWRWVMAGDSLGWFAQGVVLAEDGPQRSLLSAVGVAQFSYGQATLHNLLMWLIEPTLSFHRIGQVLVGLACLAAVYTVFARLFSPRFAVVVAVGSMTTSVMLVHTYISYPLLDGIAIAFAAWAQALWIERQPEDRRAWLAFGLATGAMWYLTQSSWPMGLLLWAYLSVRTLWRWRTWRGWLLAAAVQALVALPMWMQIWHGQAEHMFSLVRGEASRAPNYRALLVEAALFPFASKYQSAGAFGPQLPMGFRWLFVVGVAVALWRARHQRALRALLALWLAYVVFLALAQGPYETVSVKRALILIPFATAFVFLPLERWMRQSVVVVPLLALWVGLGVSDLVWNITPGRLGYTLLDGIVEASQRFRSRPVCIVLSRDPWADVYGPGGLLDRGYHLYPRVRRVLGPDDPHCAQVLCYSPQVDEHISLLALGYREVAMQNTVELRCGIRD